ncbi:MAG: hypothetical protein ACKVWV_09060 [Planctomycetota bacterium]
MDHSAERSSASTPSIVLGPGQRLAGLETLLASLGVRPVQRLADLGELLRLPATARVLLDGDGLRLEDLGLLRRCGARIVLTGEDGGRRVVKELLRTASARWIGWPLDLEDVASLLGPDRDAGRARGAESTTSSIDAVARDARTNGGRTASESRVEGELTRIEAILALPTDADSETMRPAQPREASRGRAPHVRVVDAPEEHVRNDRPSPTHAADPTRNSPPSSPPHGAPSAPPHSLSLPSFFRDQVADLADIAQRIELGTSAIADDAALDPGISGDVARLVQFTRTLGYLAAAPGPGEQTFDVAETLEVAVATHVGQDEDGPRFLFRSEGPLWVRSDRELLGLAFDAYLALARSAGRRGEIVRVHVRSPIAEDVESPARGEISIEFPAGALADLDPVRIVEPYALRRLFPMLGANALSAATAIVHGQGGQAELVRAPRGRLLWRIALPGAEPPSARSPRARAIGENAPRSTTPRESAADDPFA